MGSNKKFKDFDIESFIQKNKTEKKNYIISESQKIFEEGEKLNGIYCVRDGVVKLSKLGVNGKGHIVKLIIKGDLMDRGGNDIKVKWFGKVTNLHRVWDSQIIDSHQMSYTELSNDLDILSLKEIKKNYIYRQ